MPRILFLTAHPAEDASCRHRVLQFVPYLEQAGYECTVSSFSNLRLFRALRRKGKLATKLLQATYCTLRRAVQIARISRFDLVVIHREAFPFFTPTVENWILNRHSNVLFSFDDAIYAGHADFSSFNHPRLYRLKYGKGFSEVIRRSQHVIAGNQVLAEYARQFNSRVSVVPTVVDCERYRCRCQARINTPLTIGWMGSRSTISYVFPLESVLRRVQDRYGSKLQFRFVGFPDYRPDIPGFQSLPFDLQNEIDDLHAMDIGIMPLPDTEWTRGKCAFKAIQYMATGVATIASPVGMVTELIQHGSNGLLATSQEEWFRALCSLVEDWALRRQLAMNARQTIERSYSLQTWGPRFVELLERITLQGATERQKQPAAGRRPAAA